MNLYVFFSIKHMLSSHSDLTPYPQCSCGWRFSSDDGFEHGIDTVQVIIEVHLHWDVWQKRGSVFLGDGEDLLVFFLIENAMDVFNEPFGLFIEFADRTGEPRG